MRKNTTLRVAAVLLALTLITSCFVGGTFAKYTSSSTVNDTARVAYWGFGKAAALEFNLFSLSYDDDAVKSADTDKVIAPGTEQVATFGFAYVANTNDSIAAPEVAYTFEVDATITGDFDTLDTNTNFVWTLDGEEYQTTALLLAAIEELDGDEAYYAAGTLPEGFGVGTSHTIGWAWDFEDATDALDTQLGNMDPLENVTITIAVTAEQIDEIPAP